VRQHDVRDLRLRGEVLLDVRNDLVTGIGETAIDHLQVEIPVFGVAVFDNDGVAVAVSGAEKINHVRHRHTPLPRLRRKNFYFFAVDRRFRLTLGDNLGQICCPIRRRNVQPAIRARSPRRR
jgi:hypothetical protein